jgi:hypothetical protein
MALSMSNPSAGIPPGARRKKWIRTQQRWTWVITIAWMTVANFWHPFGLYGFVCMFTPILLALLGWGKMSCARICPRGSFLGTFCRSISVGLTMPAWMHGKYFRFTLWAVMMGTFAALMVWAIPKGIDTLGFTVLIFMESATALALIAGVLFKPRSWCTVCPMGYTSGKIRNWRQRKH